MKVREVLEMPCVQPKLVVGPPDDEFEQEADRVANQVMRMPAVSAADGSETPPIQRKCKECEDEERVQRTCTPCQERVQRAPARQGWSAQDDLQGFNVDVKTVSETGKIESGKGAKGVWRVPIEGLSHGFQDPRVQSTPKGRAVVLIPSAVGAVTPAGDDSVPVDVLLHFHGHGAGYAELKPGEHDRPGVLKPAQLRDVELYKMEQQLLSHVAEAQKAGKPPLIAVLPQGSSTSAFGDLKKESDTYLKDVVDTLKALKLLPQKAVPGRLIVSGHSGGGFPAMQVATQRLAAGQRSDIILFDGINFACTDKDSVTKECKEPSPCSSNEYGIAKKWVTTSIKNETSALSTESTADKSLAELLRDRGTRFRGFSTTPVGNTDTCSYGHWYGKLDEDINTTIDATINGLKLSGDVRDAVRNQLHENYKIRQVTGLQKLKGKERHERMIGQGDTLTGALNEVYNLPAQGSAAPPSATPAPAAPAAPATTPVTPQKLQRTVAPHPGTGTAPASVAHTLAGSGAPLDSSLLSDMEQRFDHDFSGVRVHTDAAAGRSARDITAHAYTLGDHIVFDEGRYAPGTPEGRRLIAHELTHVVQQSGAETIPRATPLRIQRQPDDVPAPPSNAPPVDPDEALIQSAVDFLAQRPAAVKSFGLSKATIKTLKDLIVNPRRVDDATLKTQLTGLTAKRRAEIADAAVARLETQISERRADTLSDLADQFEAGIDTQLPDLAAIALKAEDEETQHLATLTPKERRKVKLRPQFPLILKYICRHLLFMQVDSPQTKARILDEQWAVPLGLTKTDVLFPEIYEDALVAQLKGLPKDVRAELKRLIADRALGVVSDYIDQRMGITPDTIRDEFALLSDVTRSNIEGGIEGYFACRMGLLNKFGSPRDVPATIAAVNAYYGSLTAAEFLQQGPDPKPKGKSTLVHKDLKTALDKAEKKITDTAGWLPEVLANVKTYWSTNIRENRNNITQLSEHSFGFALDVNPDNNPNLARFGQANWNYVNTMIGENVFTDPAGNRTEAVETIRAATDPAKTMAAIEKIRGQSDRLVKVFDTEDKLRARLTEILNQRGITLGHKIGFGPIVVPVGSAQDMKALLDHAKQAVSGPPKERAGHAKQLQDTIVNELWSQNPLAAGTTNLPLALELVKTLGPAVKKLTQADQKEVAITTQIRTPADKLPRTLGKQGLDGLFKPAVVTKLKAVPESDRAALAAEVMLGLRQPLAHKQTEAQAAEIAEFVKRGFAVLAGTRKPTGEKIGGGGEMANVAAQGFANLSPKFVMAMIGADGGDLKWLGVHNQDMHHFELKNPPTVPRAVIKAEEPAPAPAVPPAPGPSPAGGPETDVSIE